MRCTSRRRYSSSISRRNRRLRKKRLIQIILKVVLVAVIIFGVGFISNKLFNKDHVKTYETKHYKENLFQGELFAQDLCVVNDNVAYPEFVTDDTFHAVSLLDLSDETALYAENIHQKVYPASITKLLTTYIALKYTSLDDIVTVGKNATILPSGSSRAWLKENDQMTMEDLLYSLLLASGNDSAIAIAEHISGSEAAFAELMNKEMKMLGATNSHFKNSHGYHDDDHYTTAYDIYLIMRECMKNPKFLEIISKTEHHTKITEPNGYQRKVSWVQTNMLINGIYQIPQGITILGGKTGNTDEAKACLVIYCQDANQTPYLATIMGAESRPILYKNMIALLETLTN